VAPLEAQEATKKWTRTMSFSAGRAVIESVQSAICEGVFSRTICWFSDFSLVFRAKKLSAYCAFAIGFYSLFSSHVEFY